MAYGINIGALHTDT